MPAMPSRPYVVSASGHVTFGTFCTITGIAFVMLLFIYPPFFVRAESPGGVGSRVSLLKLWPPWQGCLFTNKIWCGVWNVITGAVGLMVQAESPAQEKRYKFLSVLNAGFSVTLMILNAYFIWYMFFESQFFSTESSLEDRQLWILAFPCAGIALGFIEFVISMFSCSSKARGCCYVPNTVFRQTRYLAGSRLSRPPNSSTVPMVRGQTSSLFCQDRRGSQPAIGPTRQQSATVRTINRGTSRINELHSAIAFVSSNDSQVSEIRTETTNAPAITHANVQQTAGPVQQPSGYSINRQMRFQSLRVSERPSTHPSLPSRAPNSSTVPNVHGQTSSFFREESHGPQPVIEPTRPPSAFIRTVNRSASIILEPHSAVLFSSSNTSQGSETRTGTEARNTPAIMQAIRQETARFVQEPSTYFTNFQTRFQSLRVPERSVNYVNQIGTTHRLSSNSFAGRSGDNVRPRVVPGGALVKKQSATTERLKKRKIATSDVPRFSTHQYPEYESDSSRRCSFTNWHREPAVSKLVKAGLFYKGPQDTVACFSCGITLKDWKSSDEPIIRHFWSNKNCRVMLNDNRAGYVREPEDVTTGATGTLENMPQTSPVIEEHELPSEILPSAPEMDELSESPSANLSEREAHSSDGVPATVSGINISEYQQAMDRLTCKICMDAQISITFRPCGHLCVCQTCSEQLSCCPMCRETVLEKQKTFMP